MNRYSQILCYECGIPLNLEQRIFRDWCNNLFCSSHCKWEFVFREDCSTRGKRPVVPGSWWWASHKAFERDGYKCILCKSEKNLEVHHKIPISRGGNSLPENLITLCHDCHMKPGRHIGTKIRSVCRSKNVDLSKQGVLYCE